MGKILVPDDIWYLRYARNTFDGTSQWQEHGSEFTLRFEIHSHEER